MKPELLLVGLGNPGEGYARSRHNVGFWAIDRLAEEFGEGDFCDKPKFLAEVMEGRIVTAPILLIKPQTYMNRSGESVRKLLDFYKLDPANQLIVFSDDIDLPLGDIRHRASGGPGTHNGLKSVVDSCGEQFARMRIGLGEQPPEVDLANWVLSTPPKSDFEVIQQSLETLPTLVRETVLGESG